MKTKLKNAGTILTGFILTGFLLIMGSAFTQEQQKPMRKPWRAPRVEAKKIHPWAINDDINLKTGKALWKQNCQSCHGATGKGDGSKAETLNISCGDFTMNDYQKQSDGAHYWKITEGRDPMPSFEEKLTDSERWSIAYYTRTFRTTEIAGKETDMD